MKQKPLKPEDEAFRKLVLSLDGHQQSVAEALGVTRQAVVKRLYSEKHSAWWCDYKARRAKERTRARRARWYQRRKQALADAQRVLEGSSEAERLLLKAILDEL